MRFGVQPLSLATLAVLTFFMLPASPTWPLGSGEAASRLPIKPVLVVHSPGSFKREPYNTHYALLTVQYSLLLAGIPYEVLNEDELPQRGGLDGYSCLIFPYHRWVSRNFSAWLLGRLPGWVEGGGGIICMGVPVEQEGGQFVGAWLSFYRELFGVDDVFSRRVTERRIIMRRHPITADYPDGHEVMVQGEVYDYFRLSPGSNASIFLYTYPSDPVGLASSYGRGRAVLFSIAGYDSIFQRTKILLRAIQWVVFGEHTPIGLGITCGRVAWMLNVDADWSADMKATRRALHWLLKRSEERCFPFSWALITGRYGDFKRSIDWDALRPLLNASLRAGVEIASHTVHHPVWRGVGEGDAWFELVQSRRDIAGNLTEVYGFQVPDGMFPIQYYHLVSEAGYRYLIQTFAEPFLRMVGVQPLPNGSRVFCFWRGTRSDYYYFDYLRWTSEGAYGWEVENFERFYDLGHSAPYILLWHDYSFINETRRKMFEWVLEFEYWNRTDVFPLTPMEFLHRFQAWRRLRFSVAYEDGAETVWVDARLLSPSDLPYTSAMSIHVDGEVGIGWVSLSGEPYPLFSNQTVILPELRSGVYEFKIVHGRPNTPHITHLTSCRIHSARLVGEQIRLEVSRLGDNRLRIFLAGGTNLTVNGTPVSLEEFNGLFTACLTLEEVEIPGIEAVLTEFLMNFLAGILIVVAVSAAILGLRRVRGGRVRTPAEGTGNPQRFKLC